MIYVITKGDYSDYHICAATTDRARAERLRELYSDAYDEARIQEFKDGASNIDEERAVTYYTVKLERKNDSVTADARKCSKVLKAGEIFTNKIDKRYKNVSFEVSAENASTAIKIARDMYAKMMAEKSGL